MTPNCLLICCHSSSLQGQYVLHCTAMGKVSGGHLLSQAEYLICSCALFSLQQSSSLTLDQSNHFRHLSLISWPGSADTAEWMTSPCMKRRSLGTCGSLHLKTRLVTSHLKRCLALSLCVRQAATLLRESSPRLKLESLTSRWHYSDSLIFQLLHIKCACRDVKPHSKVCFCSQHCRVRVTHAS